MNNKELKNFYQNKTLGEIKGIYAEKIRTSIFNKKGLREKALELANLDFDTKYYADKAKALINDISFYKTHIKEDENTLKIIKPILDKKELEGISQNEYKDYITNNTDIKVLIKAVNDDKQSFINDGCKVMVCDNNNNKKEITLTEKEVNEIYESMLKELIMILKDNIGNIIKVDSLKSNSNRGMDGCFKGEKGNITINTVMAGGYNIQKLHFRTLIYKY